ncbi:ATP-binding protein [Patescibacteria group bacterium]|nr:ATP-binding protein [Patescibacteria group bacterium]
MNKTVGRTKTPAAGQSSISVHHGRAIMLLAERYHFLMDSILEHYQNGLDANATYIECLIDLDKRTVRIRDNGDGASISKFDRALRQVCETMKAEDKFGQFGLGVVSATNKCEQFTFTSVPKATAKDNQPSYICWEFNQAYIASHKGDNIPVNYTALPDMRFSRKPGDGTWWRTEVYIRNYTKDSRIGRIDINHLRTETLGRYSTKMIHNNAKVSIQVKSKKKNIDEKVEFAAESFQGKALPKFQANIGNSRRDVVTFRLFLANSIGGRRSGTVYVTEHTNPYRLDIKSFLKGNAGSAAGLLSKETVAALLSGAFEGEIIAHSRAKLAENRKEFVENDGMVELCEAMEDWYENIGEGIITEIADSETDNLYQTLGARSLRVVSTMLEKPEFATLKEIVKSFKVGNIGKGHYRDGQEGKQDDQPGIAVKKTAASDQPSPSDTCGKPRKDHPEKTQPGHTPWVVKGKKGKPRTQVKHGSIGLTFQYDELEGVNDLWELDPVHGILHFNVRHPHWSTLEDRSRSKAGGDTKIEALLMKLQEYVAIQALLLETTPPELREAQENFILASIPANLFLMEHGDDISGRKKKTGRKLRSTKID